MEHQYRCERCGERLAESRIAWLELNRATGRYHKPGEVPPEESQGGFAFGKRCAAKQLAESAAAR